MKLYMDGSSAVNFAHKFNSESGTKTSSWYFSLSKQQIFNALSTSPVCLCVSASAGLSAEAVHWLWPWLWLEMLPNISNSFTLHSFWTTHAPFPTCSLVFQMAACRPCARLKNGYIYAQLLQGKVTLQPYNIIVIYWGTMQNTFDKLICCNVFYSIDPMESLVSGLWVDTLND